MSEATKRWWRRNYGRRTLFWGERRQAEVCAHCRMTRSDQALPKSHVADQDETRISGDDVLTDTMAALDSEVTRLEGLSARRGAAQIAFNAAIRTKPAALRLWTPFGGMPLPQR